MPFYSFETKDNNINEEDRVFVVKLSFNDYDKVMYGKTTEEGWFSGENGPIHPKSEMAVTTWRRLMDKVNCNFAQPQESSKWDNFGYRAGYNMVKAQKERMDAEAKSHMGSNPYGQAEGMDLGKHDLENFENRAV